MIETGLTLPRVPQPFNLPGRMSDTALYLEEHTSYEDWYRVGEHLQYAARGIMWWLGDWQRFGERRWGEKYAQAMAVTGRSYQLLADAAWVAEQFPPSSRLEGMSWSHHQEAARLPPEFREPALKMAQDQDWSRDDLRGYVKDLKKSLDAGTDQAPYDPFGDLCAALLDGMTSDLEPLVREHLESRRREVLMQFRITKR